MKVVTHRCKGCHAGWMCMAPTYPGHCGPNGCRACREYSWTCVEPGRGCTTPSGPICGPCCDVAVMTDQIEPVGFHAREGLFFVRLPMGGVCIEKRSEDNRYFESRIVLTAEAWASVVASMSAAGETYDTWKAALDQQHGKTKETT